MPQPRSFRAEGVVLRSSPMGEAGLLVTLFTKESGKLRAVVRGARKPSSRMVGHLELLSCVDLALARSRPGSLDLVTQAQVLESFPDLRNRLEAVSSGMYLAELVDGFGAEGSANPELYHLLVETLRELDRGAPGEMVLRYFELKVLKFSGFMPELHLCVECRKELRPGSHLFSPEAGGTVCPPCARMGQRVYQLSVPALKVLRFFSRSSLEGASSLRADNDLGQELKILLSATLKYWLDKEIHSKSFLEHLGNPRNPGV